MAQPPRPFVLRVAHLAGRTIETGQRFSVGINFFETRRPALSDFVLAFGGINLAELQSIEQDAPECVSLVRTLEGTQHLRVDFLTPTELKSSAKGGRLAAKPDFHALFARARDRVSALRAFYGPGPLAIDFKAMGQRAREIRMIHCNIKRVGRARVSKRTGQIHGIGGFIGVAEYEGELGEFLPVLEAARWTGVGRHCVWGNGEILPRLI